MKKEITAVTGGLLFALSPAAQENKTINTSKWSEFHTTFKKQMMYV